MQFNTQHYIAAKECRYTMLGKNLAEMRRADLRLITISIEANAEGSKQDILAATLKRLDSRGAPNELSEWKP